MHKVLILTAGFGCGHYAAANNLRDALEQTSENVQTEVMDLFGLCYGKGNHLARHLYLGVVEHLPRLWAGVYSILDRQPILENHVGQLTRVRETLCDILKTMEPDVVVSTYPVYGSILDEIYKHHHERPFSQITVVTDSISVHALWYRSYSDWFLVANDVTAEVLKGVGVPSEKIVATGFPISPRFNELRNTRKDVPRKEDLKRAIYIINTGRKKSGRVIERMIEIPNLHLTVTCSNAELKGKLMTRTATLSDRVTVLGWTNQMPELLSSSHVVITKAGGAIVQEAIGARCPLIINQVIPGQEAGNARLIEELEIGAVASGDEGVLEHLRNLFANNGRLWNQWYRAVSRHSRPDAALRIAEFILNECHDQNDGPHRPRLIPSSPSVSQIVAFPSPVASVSRPLLCDFHTHTNYSDGKLTVSELVDFYGQRNFDCICITDHLAEKRRLVGRLVNLGNFTLPWNQIEEYFDVIEREKKRAWKKYNLLLMTGLEFNKDGLTKKSSAHLLGIDLQSPIDPNLDLPLLIQVIHRQGGLAVASHPHEASGHWGKDTLYLWEHQDEFAPLLDAWEIANRDDLFNPVGLKRLPFLANSDFHKPKHICSWKTLLSCEKHRDAIKQCIRANRDIGITLYRDASLIGRGLVNPRMEPARTLLPGDQMIMPFIARPARAASA
jgi:UDP-N-acetylglucosamine:LPS N-acetylglucosamine transferase